jgi:prepilin-type N-terminal cleavage/methylation domain-containing protein
VRPIRRRRGFTIIELAIVLAIVAILATMAVYTYNKVANKARFTQAKTALKHLDKMETLYFTNHDRYTDNVVLLDFDPVKYDYYDISVTLLDNALNYIGYANGAGAMEGDLWFITPGGAPTQDNVARTRF